MGWNRMGWELLGATEIGQWMKGKRLLMSWNVGATREQMSEARLPLAYRDSCANLLIPLNRCRYEEYYLPWKCEVCWHKFRAWPFPGLACDMEY